MKSIYILIYGIFIIILISCGNKNKPYSANHEPKKDPTYKVIEKEKAAIDSTKLFKTMNDYLKDFLTKNDVKEEKNTRKYLLGDLNNDGYDDLVVQYMLDGKNQEDRGSGTAFYEIAVFINNEGKYKYHSSIEAEGGRLAYKILKINNGFLFAKTKEYSEDDGMCCPSIKVNLKYHLKENKIIRIKY
jgi:hypothetical protein